MDKIQVLNANVHNLQHVSLEIPRDKLVVFTGVSGSGKSSLAFDTIYAEGQRRYIESLNAYARQFIEQFDKPDVAAIDGLSPAIAIDQKTTSVSPRSTVGTVTEIYDFLRVLYARVGTPHCPQCDRAIQPQSLQKIVQSIWDWPEGTKVQILSPVVRGRKGEYNALFQQLRKEGVARVRVDGELLLLDELPDDYRLVRTKVHNIEAVIDRIILKHTDALRQRLTEAVQNALRKSDGFVILEKTPPKGETQEIWSSQHLACPDCDLSFDEIAPRMFSFNSPYGACPDCEGLGVQFRMSEERMVPDPGKTLADGAIAPLEKATGRYYQTFIKKLAKQYGIRINVPFEKLDERETRLLFYGEKPEKAIKAADLKSSDPESPNFRPGASSSSESDDDDDWFNFVGDFDGIVNILKRRYQNGTTTVRRYINTFMQEETCPTCEGKRLKPVSLAVTLGGLSIDALCELSIRDAYQFIRGLAEQLNDTQREIGRQAIIDVEHRLRFLCDVGLEYLSLSRRAQTLSGGESQRIRLATQIGSGLSGVLYVLDEPSIGLHPYNNRQLIDTLCRLRDQGNSLIVVEHDEDTIRTADWVVDIGPGAGRHGGQVVAEGPPDAIREYQPSVTTDFLSGKRVIPIPDQPRTGNGQALTLHGITCHNLKNITARFPLGKLICVTGMSGSGKSTLVFDVLYEVLRYHLGRHQTKPTCFESVEGLEHIDACIDIDQSPIGRSRRSNPVTYTGLFDPIRRVFASTEMAKTRGYSVGRFSFNVATGRCEACKGEGEVTIEMNFLPNATTVCEVCEGRRYNRETLAVTYQGKNIAEVLDMTVEEAYEFFSGQPGIRRMLQILREVGLDYIHLGQPAHTLSGGEAQRIKLATELMRKSTGKTLYLMDEPSIGLHWSDLEKLIQILHRLADQGNTVIVIEHNLDLIKVADHVIDMGPEGGARGGEIIAEGPPRQIADSTTSLTGRFLRSYFGL
jgi:excinuclease ABC subunit A